MKINPICPRCGRKNGPSIFPIPREDDAPTCRKCGEDLLPEKSPDGDEEERKENKTILVKFEVPEVFSDRGYKARDFKLKFNSLAALAEEMNFDISSKMIYSAEILDETEG